MSGDIDPEILKSNAPNTVGDSITINHVGCPAGEDQKRRLWIIRNHNSIGWNCMHCGGKGRLFLKNSERTRGTAAPRVLKTTPWPSNRSIDEAEWPPEARGWLRKYGISEFEANDAGVAYLPDERRLQLPIVAYDGMITGWQERALYPYQTIKYITRTLGNTSPVAQGAWVLDGPNRTNRVMVVEDIASAIKLGQYIDTVAMLGTRLMPEVRNIIAEKYEAALVWLDPDEAGFKAARVVCGELENFLNTTHITSEVQPKEATDIKIRAHLGY